MSSTISQAKAVARRRIWARLAAQAAIVVVLLCLAASNISLRTTWSEMEDGVLWVLVNDQIIAS